jgi:hypothetical protein
MKSIRFDRFMLILFVISAFFFIWAGFALTPIAFLPAAVNAGMALYTARTL